MTFDYNENLLQFIWEQQLYRNNEITTLSGESLTIVKQGILNKNSGPDFENAHIKLGKTDFFGTIEIHITDKDWYAHNHQVDDAYNNVILHVCYFANSEVTRKDGSKIPTLCLYDKLDHRYLAKYQNLLEEQQFIPCENQIHLVSALEIHNWLDRMVIEKLEHRCVQFQHFLEQTDNNWNSTFYIALTRTFGMPINTLAFEEIALKLPFELIQKHNSSLLQLEALLFGVAGLLEQKITDHYYIHLQNEFVFLQKKYGLEVISAQLKTGKMRPMNLPHIKLAQLAALFYHVPNWTSEILTTKSEDLKTLLSFSLSEYWLTHYNFKKESSSVSKSLSNQSIHLLLLNAIIPFVFLYETQKLNKRADQALEHLLAIPPEKNKVMNHWKQLGIEIKSAHSSQALLHLYKSYCQKKLCLNCMIGKKILLDK